MAGAAAPVTVNALVLALLAAADALASTLERMLETVALARVVFAELTEASRLASTLASWLEMDASALVKEV